MLASTAAKVAAVAAQFPTVCEDYIQALWDLAFVRPVDFRVQIAMEECFFQAIQYILDTRGLQDVQLTVDQWIATLCELQYGQCTEIQIVPDDESGELPPRQALHGTSAVAAIEIIRAGFQGNVCDERKSDITGRVEKMAYVAYDEDNTAWGYAGNRDANYSPDAISDVGPLSRCAYKCDAQTVNHMRHSCDAARSMEPDGCLQSSYRSGLKSSAAALSPFACLKSRPRS